MTANSSIQSTSEPGALCRCFWVILVLCTLLGGSLRLYQLNGGSIWIDEIWSVRDALQPDKMRPTRGPGYLPITVVLWAAGFDHPTIRIEDVGSWRAEGLDLWHIRLGPSILGILTIPLLGWAVRRAWGTKIAIAFMVLLCFAPWHIYWSQLGRYYTLKFLLLGLSLALYYHGTRKHKPWSTGIGLSMAYLAYLVHPPAMLIGLAFAADYALSWIRRDPIRLGKTGWIVGFAVPIAVILTMVVESQLSDYDKFLGATPDPGQSGPLVLANAVFMLGLPLVVFTAAVWLTMIRDQEGQVRQTAWYLFFSAAIPIFVFVALGLMGKFSQVRYTFESLMGVLLLASFGLVYIHDALLKTRGRLIAVSPALVLIASMGLVLASYYTQGHHLHRRWGEAFAYVEQHRQPGENVVSAREVVAQYYLGDNSVKPLPGVLHLYDMWAEGKPLWIVDAGQTAVTTRRPVYVDYAQLMESYPIHVWQPFTDMRVYRYIPRPEAIWRAEKAEMDAAAAAEQEQATEAAPQ